MKRKIGFSVVGMIFILLGFVLLQKKEPEVQESETYLREMIELREKEEVKESEVDGIVDVLSQVEPEMIEMAYHQQVKIVLTDYGFDELPNFRVNMSGLENYAGFFVPDENTMYVQMGRKHNNSEKVALHEFGHVMDYELGGNTQYLSEVLGEEFDEIKKEKPQTIPEENTTLSDENPNYYGQTKEYFAETFAMYYLSDRTKDNLEETGPLTYQLIDSLKYRLLQVNEYNQSSYTIEWLPAEQVAEYEIYQNSQLIDTIDGNESEYQVKIKQTSAYFFDDYKINLVALDTNGQELFTTTTADTIHAPINISNLEKLVEQTEQAIEKEEINRSFITYDLEKAEAEIKSFQEKDGEYRQSDILSTEMRLQKALDERN